MAEKKETKTAKKNDVKDAAKVSMSMKKDELLKAAEEMGVKVASKATKADIIAAIEAAAKSKPADDKAEAAPEKKEPETETEEKAEATVESEAPKSEETAELKASTERKRKEKAERREAKAARKEANKIEEKKTRPNNILLAILIIGVLVGMFAFVGGYNYFTRPADIEAYLEESGMGEMYNNMSYDENSTMKMKAEGNTLKIVVKVNEDASDEVIENYKSEDGEEQLKYAAASLLTGFKPETRGFGGEVRLAVKKGDETIAYYKMTNREAKKFLKELEEKAEEEADNAEDAAEDEHDHDHEGEGEDVTVETEEGADVEVVTDESAE